MVLVRLLPIWAAFYLEKNSFDISAAVSPCAASYIKNYYDDFMRSKCRLIIKQKKNNKKAKRKRFVVFREEESDAGLTQKKKTKKGKQTFFGATESEIVEGIATHVCMCCSFFCVISLLLLLGSSHRK